MEEEWRFFFKWRHPDIHTWVTYTRAPLAASRQ